MAAYQSLFGDITMDIDGVVRRVVPWADWAITTRIDTTAYWRQVFQAVAGHRSPLPDLDRMRDLPEETHLKFWGWPTH